MLEQDAPKCIKWRRPVNTVHLAHFSFCAPTPPAPARPFSKSGQSNIKLSKRCAFWEIVQKKKKNPQRTNSDKFLSWCLVTD